MESQQQALRKAVSEAYEYIDEKVRSFSFRNELSLRRGNQSGSELDDWLQAEKEFLQDEAIDEDAAEMFGQP